MKTEDIVLAATLKTFNFKLVGIEKTGNKGRFEFENVPHQFLTDYDLGNLTVEPRLFHNNLRSLTSSVKR